MDHNITKPKLTVEELRQAQAAMERATLRAGEIAKQTNTPLIIYQDGKIVRLEVR